MLTNSPVQSIDSLTVEYTSALGKYLAEGGESALQKAYEIGRAAILADLGVLDIAELHHQAMDAILHDAAPDVFDVRMERAAIFLEESLSPFEITYRGYRNAIDVMRRVSNFAFIASHEIKGPLTSIMSSASMLTELLHMDSGSIENRLITNILNGVTILKSHIDNMMDIASLYSGALNIRVRLVSAQEFLDQVFELLEPEVKWQGMELNLHFVGNLPQVEMDPDRIQQVITNLVQNAVKYAAEGGRIDLSVSAREDELIFEVRDHGRGLSLREQGILFVKDGLGVRSKHAQGTGLGLILCREIVEAHKGRIILTSKPGYGSAFEVCLPIGKKSQSQGIL